MATHQSAPDKNLEEMLPMTQTQGIKLRKEAENFIPRLGNIQALICVATTTVLFAYAGIFGFTAILVIYAMWFSRIKYRGSFTLKPTRDCIYVLLFPAYACLSFLWSSVPNISLYTSLEYTSSILCAIIMARITTTLSFLRGLSIGITIVLIASIASHRYGTDPFTGSYSLVGLFGSKNQVGLYAELGIFVAFLGMFYPQKRIQKFIYCLSPLCISIITLYLSKSAASILSLALVFAMIIAAYIITRLPKNYRGFACAITAVWFTVILATGLTLNWQESIFKSFGKDSTMTGRTLLWQKGIETGMNAPILGYGYSGFWVQGNLKAEQLWYRFEIPARGGFHFHNLFVETFVELGGIGVFLISLLLLQNILKSFRRLLQFGMDREYLFALGISVMFFIRAMVEVDLVGTFGIGPILVMGLMPRLAMFEKERLDKKSKRQNA